MNFIKLFFAALCTAWLLAACAVSDGLPKPQALPALTAGDTRWFKLEAQDEAGNIEQASLLAVQRDGEKLRFVQTDALGAPLSRQTVGSVQLITFWILSYTVRPSRTAATMEAKLSSASTRSAASLAASLPVWPMAMPASARLSAGASLTPSPVIATVRPCDCSAFTSRSLWAGEVRANTSVSRMRPASPASSIKSKSLPVSTLSVWVRPISRAMARAVAA